jgi:hypothetical protein
VTHDEALKLQWGSSFEGLKHGDIAGISEASGKTNRAQGFLEGYEEGVNACIQVVVDEPDLTVDNLAYLRSRMLSLLDAKEKKG